MNIFVDKEQLVKGVNHVAKAVSPRTVIPVLSGIKFDADEQGILLTASDADISISYRIPKTISDQEVVTVEKAGSVVIPARYFIEIVKKLPGDKVQIRVLEHFLTSIVSGSSEFNLHGMDAEEYPRLPQIEEESSFYLSSILLKSLIRQTSFAVSALETRPILTGVQWNIVDGHLIFIATDSHRLARGKIRIDQGQDLQLPSFVVPGKSLNELYKILEDKDEPVEIVLSGNQLLLRSEQLLFYSRLLVGSYPDTSRIIPTTSKTTVVLDTKTLHDALERASLIASKDRNNVVKMSSSDTNELVISSFYPEVGKLSETIPVASIEGEELKISFNAKYMLDALKVIDSTDVELYFTGAMSPFVIRPVGQEDPLHLIVPVRTF